MQQAQRSPHAGQLVQGSAGPPELSTLMEAHFMTLTGLNHAVTPSKETIQHYRPPPQVLLNNQQTGWHLEYGFSSVSSTFHRHSLYPWAINFISKKHIVLSLHERMQYSPCWKHSLQFDITNIGRMLAFFFPWVGGGFWGFFCLKPLWTGQR